MQATFLNKLLESLEEAVNKMEEYYRKGDSLKFNSSKKLALQIQKQIEESLK